MLLAFLFFVLPVAAYMTAWVLITLAAGRRWGGRGYVITTCVFVAGILAVLFGAARWLSIYSGEDYGAPPVDRIALPASAQVAATGSECGSGGCWAVVSLTPADGVSRETMLRDLETAERCTPGTTFDPRPVCWSPASAASGYDLDAYFVRPR